MAAGKNIEHGTWNMNRRRWAYFIMQYFVFRACLPAGRFDILFDLYTLKVGFSEKNGASAWKVRENTLFLHSISD